jgi:hypothetical protein
MNPNFKAAAAQPAGSTGNLPVPRGYQPRGTEVRMEKFQAFPATDAASRSVGPVARRHRLVACATRAEFRVNHEINPSRKRLMKTLFAAIGAITLLGLLMPKANAADALRPDADGYIRHWVMLAPIALSERESCAEALLKDQVPNEAALRPKAGDQVTVGGKELTWRNVTAATNYFDFNETLKSINDHVAGYMVTYIECAEEMPDVILAVASNDQGRLYFNGVDIYAFTEARPLMLDADKGRVTLKKGVNTFVFKVTNEQNAWQGAMRFLDKSGAPVRGLKIKLTP